jgi:hypothetical protein
MSTLSQGIALLMALAKMRALSVGKCSGLPYLSRCLETMYGLIRCQVLDILGCLCMYMYCSMSRSSRPCMYCSICMYVYVYVYLCKIDVVSYARNVSGT